MSTIAELPRRNPDLFPHILRPSSSIYGNASITWGLSSLPYVPQCVKSSPSAEEHPRHQPFHRTLTYASSRSGDCHTLLPQPAPSPTLSEPGADKLSASLQSCELSFYCSDGS